MIINIIISIDDDVKEEEKGKVNFGLTGALAKDERTGNVQNGVVLKWSEPDEAAMPTRKWRLYCFKGEDLLQNYYLHRQSAFSIGRDDKVCDLVCAHPSISKQHAVIQYRAMGEEVKPYLMDLGSTNKTFLNGNELEDARYYELREKDLIKFGQSQREYVVICEK